MMNIEPGGGCALYVALTAKTPSQRGVTMRVAVIGVVVVEVASCAAIRPGAMSTASASSSGSA
jgi:FtsH-binding integral membrane protein